ncbi:calcium/sodium antiporter [Bermanella marisrubri]|uniref:Ca2+/Na+ antiporter n=1 Tax=Bermanella marisrubri TaxID=207949 RepID=Q1MYN2_9GAMM|nr:calcium/sodium antiporter [Bermanella marisrubri]EAT11084.1 Ca2+/Na+ antiporter [Oceanobacter sp. RED65] [Bermanella marisrubri]QIZ83415.1 calcium/sodium antiporter [Bermanella marisrubri]
MLYPALAILIGLIVLVWSADRFVLGAAATARHFGMSPLLIGMTIVSLGTSAPEIFVSTTAAIDGAGGLAIGNALGSNIANIGLVLGITALIAPLPIQGKMLKKEMPILLLVSVIAGLTLQDLAISFMDSVIMFICLIITLFWLFNESNDQGIGGLEEEEAEAIEQMSTSQSVMWLIIGIVALIASAKILVWGAVEVATALGVSELVIGLTIVAIGTSLPELAASVASALKGHHDIAIGNVVGSNIFNLLAVMPIPGLFAKTVVESDALYRDYGAMMGLTLFLIAFVYIFRKRGRVGRSAGSIMLLAYLSYLGLLFVQH